MSGEAKHTKGPWEVGYRSYDVIAADGRMKVCDIRGWGYLTGAGSLGLDATTASAIQDANARLIAAAPALLRAGANLARVADDKMATVRETVEAVKAMRAAISLATGDEGGR